MASNKNDPRYKLHYQFRKLGGRVNTQERVIEKPYDRGYTEKQFRVVDRLLALGYTIQLCIE